MNGYVTISDRMPGSHFRGSKSLFSLQETEGRERASHQIGDGCQFFGITTVIVTNQTKNTGTRYTTPLVDS